MTKEIVCISRNNKRNKTGTIRAINGTSRHSRKMPSSKAAQNHLRLPESKNFKRDSHLNKRRRHLLPLSACVSVCVNSKSAVGCGLWAGLRIKQHATRATIKQSANYEGCVEWTMGHTENRINNTSSSS